MTLTYQRLQSDFQLYSIITVKKKKPKKRKWKKKREAISGISSTLLHSP